VFCNDESVEKFDIVSTNMLTGDTIDFQISHPHSSNEELCPYMYRYETLQLLYEASTSFHYYHLMVKMKEQYRKMKPYCDHVLIKQLCDDMFVCIQTIQHMKSVNILKHHCIMTARYMSQASQHIYSVSLDDAFPRRHQNTDLSLVRNAYGMNTTQWLISNDDDYGVVDNDIDIDESFDLSHSLSMYSQSPFATQAALYFMQNVSAQTDKVI